MTTTITTTPRPDDAAIDVRIVRDDTNDSNIVAQWMRTTPAAAQAELANWTGAEAFGEVISVSGGDTRPLNVTAGSRYLVEAFTSSNDVVRAGTTLLADTRDKSYFPSTANAYRRVAEIVAPSGGFTLNGGGLAYGLPVFGYKVTKLTEQRIMMGPDFVAGNETAWTLDTAAPFVSKSVNFGNALSGLYFTWYNPNATATVAAGALKANRSISTTAGRDYVITAGVDVDVLGSSTGLVVEVLDGSTVITSQEVATNSDETVKLSFTAPGTSVTLRVKNRQPFNVTGGSGYNARYYVRSLLVERLNSDDLSAVKYTLTTLNRTDANGVRTVRMPRNADLVDGVLSITDYEPALDGLVKYTAVTERVGLSGTRDIATSSTRLDRTGDVFTQANTPQLRFDAEMVETYSATNETSAVFHDVIGRADPVVSTGVQRLRSGSMRLFFHTYEDAKDAIAVAGRGEPILWRSTANAGLDMFFIAGRVSSAPYDLDITPRKWYVDVEFREVAAPTTPIDTDAAWNFATSAERNPTFFDSFMEFSTFADLLNGPEVI